MYVVALIKFALPVYLGIELGGAVRGIILAGGTGSRLAPITTGVSKQLMPVFDKPMVFYPLSTLLLAGIREILVICNSGDKTSFEKLLLDGSQWGISIQYAIQTEPRGLADAFIVGKEFIGESSVALVLGDNLFFGAGLGTHLQDLKSQVGANIFAYQVANPSDYGIVEFDGSGRAISLEEKPKNPRSKFAVPGLYFFDNQVVQVAENLEPSSRGELEITDVNSWYLERGQLNVNVMPRGTAWLDTGSFAALNDAGNYVRAIEERQGMKIGAPEEVAWRMGYISSAQLEELAQKTLKSGYGKYLLDLLEKSE